MMHYKTSFLMTNLLLLVTVAIGVSLGQIQSGVKSMLLTNTIAVKALSYEGPQLPSPEIAVSPRDTENVTQMFMFLWCTGGSVLGAYIGLAVGLSSLAFADSNSRTLPILARAFAVSLFTGMLGAPFIAHQYLSPAHWTTCFALGGGIAASAWILWNKVPAIINYFIGKFMPESKRPG